MLQLLVILYFFAFPALADWVIIKVSKPILNNDKIEVVTFYDPLHFLGYYTQARESISSRYGVRPLVHYQHLDMTLNVAMYSHIYAQYLMVSEDIQVTINELLETKRKIAEAEDSLRSGEITLGGRLVYNIDTMSNSVSESMLPQVPEAQPNTTLPVSTSTDYLYDMSDPVIEINADEKQPATPVVTIGIGSYDINPSIYK